MTTQIDSVSAREVALYTTNTEALYTSRALPIIKNLARKRVNGTYDAAKAPKIWLYLARDGMKAYNREFKCDLRLNAATLTKCAEELAEHYEDLIAETVADIRRDQDLRKTWTMATIRDFMQANGSHFFDRETLKFFGETMKNFKSRVVDGVVYVDRTGGRAGSKSYRFNIETRDLEQV